MQKNLMQNIKLPLLTKKHLYNKLTPNPLRYLILLGVEHYAKVLK